MADRSIMLNDYQVQSIAAGRRRHICMPARYRPGGRFTVSAEATAEAQKRAGLPMPTPWCVLVPGDRLWVQEATVSVIDDRNPMARKDYFRADLVGGLAPIPGGARAGRWSRVVFEAKRMPRANSRYILTVEAVDIFRAQNIGWGTIDAEGSMRYPSDSKNQWWDRHYGMLYPWAENPEMVGITFSCSYENIDGHHLPDRSLRRPGATMDDITAAAERAFFKFGGGDGV